MRIYSTRSHSDTCRDKSVNKGKLKVSLKFRIRGGKRAKESFVGSWKENANTQGNLPPEWETYLLGKPK